MTKHSLILPGLSNVEAGNGLEEATDKARKMLSEFIANSAHNKRASVPKGLGLRFIQRSGENYIVRDFSLFRVLKKAELFTFRVHVVAGEAPTLCPVVEYPPQLEILDTPTVYEIARAVNAWVMVNNLNLIVPRFFVNGKEFLVG